MEAAKKKYNEGAMEKDHMDEVYQMGKEAAFNEMDPRRFKALDKNEEKVFLEGYKEGLEIQKNNAMENERRLAA